MGKSHNENSFTECALLGANPVGFFVREGSSGKQCPDMLHTPSHSRILGIHSNVSRLKAPRKSLERKHVKQAFSWLHLAI